MKSALRHPLLHILAMALLAIALVASLYHPVSVGAQSSTPNPGARTENFFTGESPFSLKVSYSQRTPKLQSALAELATEAKLRGLRSALGVARWKSVSTHDGAVRVVVEMEGAETTSLRALLQRLGSREESSYGKLVSALVPIAGLDELAATPEVRFVGLPLESIPLVESEGVATVNASGWHSQGFTGRNVKVAVVDAGFKDWQARRASGELPPTAIARSFRSDGDIEAGRGAGTEHGTGAAEIVYDMAPEAQLYLVNYGTQVDLGNAVDWLIGQGVRVISYSMGWFNAGPGDGTGVIGDIVAKARDGGILWVSSAGNHAQRHWEGYFSDADSDGWHNFTPGDEGNSVYLYGGEDFRAYLSWDDWPSGSQDYDLYLFPSGSSQPVGSSENVQTGAAPPIETLSYKPSQSGWYTLAIRKYDSSRSVYFELYSSRTDLEHQVRDSSLLIPADSPNALAVGAVPYYGNSLENFSSRGPTNGSNPRIKPDLVAPNRVSTTTYGSEGFAGTSASAPHVAGAAALVLGRFPQYTSTQLQRYLEGLAVPLGAPGQDNLYGWGLINLGAAPALSVSPTSLEAMGEVSGTYLNPLTLQIINSGTGTLSWSATPDSPWVVVSPTSGTASASITATMTVTFSITTPTPLAPGIHDSYIRITSTSNPPSISVPVRLILSPNGQMRRTFLPLAEKHYVNPN